MDFSSEKFTIFFYLILFCIILLSVLNIIYYVFFRNGFYISVNCWFCNENSKVLYSLRNGFECPYCLQYNGFAKDGGYNKIIKAQHESSGNFEPVGKNYTIENGFASTSLCTTCNHNMHLKVFQLANFVPLDEKKYNIEVEHFEQQLDKAYKLCFSCEKILKHTIRQQDKWIFGRHLKGLQKRFALSELKNQGYITKGLIIFKCIRIALILLALVSFFKVRDFDTKPLRVYKNYLPESMVILGNELKNYYFTFQDILTKLESDLQSYFKKLPKLFTTGLTGVLLELILISLDDYSRWFKANEILCWMILTIRSSNLLSSKILSYLNILEVSCSGYLIFNYGFHLLKSPLSHKYNLKRIKLTVNNCNNCVDLDEQAEEKLIFMKKANNFRHKLQCATAKKRHNATPNISRFYRTDSTFNISTRNQYSDSEEEFYGSTFTNNKSSKKSGLSNSFSELKLNMEDNPFLPNEGKSNLPWSRPKDSSCQIIKQSSSPNLYSKNVLSNNSFSSHYDLSSNGLLQSSSPFCRSNEFFTQPQNFVSTQSFQNNLNNSRYLFGSHNMNSTFTSNYLRPGSSLFMAHQLNGNVKCDSYPQKPKLASSNLFRPVSPSYSILSNSSQSILSPPKLNITSRPFSFQSQPTLAYQSILVNQAFLEKDLTKKSNLKYLSKGNFCNLNNSLVPTRPNSRASSESSGFASNNELFKGISQTNSRNSSPDRNFGNSQHHLKKD